ncbi:unnamed protein product [Amoebophrya sp. A25]|nr:unnamed protein product [Amoebophrya sp. A25]
MVLWGCLGAACRLSTKCPGGCFSTCLCRCTCLPFFGVGLIVAAGRVLFTMTAPANAPGPRRPLLGLSCICLACRSASDSAFWPSVGGLWIAVDSFPNNNSSKLVVARV